ncbi:hypothetical protein [Prauserella cavernicola]|uniref:Uncharacterized protein n=1 Tax=Prauserella cavernicola TaxID=2800127 RepID=A0A934QXU1_9PSEU|nr:hypothetical protein [Prauserella cavernicola]MBK1788476.1 hypothetical protein [Prauserella cavernicola]
MGALHRRTEPVPQRGREAARVRARRFLTGAPGVPGELLASVFHRDGFYRKLADQLLDDLPLRRRVLRGHRLCTQLDQRAAYLDPTAYTMLAQTPVREALLRLGFPKYLADPLSSEKALGARCILVAVARTDLEPALRTLIALVCPALEDCPACLAVHTTFATPGVDGRLAELAGHRPARPRIAREGR